MKIEVRLFAVLREKAGVDRVELELPNGSKVADARTELGRMFPSIAPMLARVATAVNREYVPADVELHNDDELALIPPVSGG